MAGQARKTQKIINHETHKTHEKLTTVNFLLRKNLTVDFVIKVQKNKKRRKKVGSIGGSIGVKL